MYSIVFISVALYFIVGVVLVLPGFIFDVTNFVKKVNPVQDTIGWMPTIPLLVFWLPLLIIWHASTLLRLKRWQSYKQHSDRIDDLVSSFQDADDNDDDEWGAYRVPSPKEFRKKGTSSLRFGP